MSPKLHIEQPNPDVDEVLGQASEFWDAYGDLGKFNAIFEREFSLPRKTDSLNRLFQDYIKDNNALAASAVDSWIMAVHESERLAAHLEDCRSVYSQFTSELSILRVRQEGLARKEKELCKRERQLEAQFRRRRVTNAKRQQVMKRDGSTCTTCGSQDNLQIDHVIPFSKGGSCEIGNLQVLCGTCNLKKGAA